MKRKDMVIEFRKMVKEDWSKIDSHNAYNLNIDEFSLYSLRSLHNSRLLKDWSHKTSEMGWNISFYSYKRADRKEFFDGFGYRDLKCDE